MDAVNTRLAVVTGGIGGLGTEICRHLARSGRRVIAADLGREDRVAEFREELREFNGAIHFEPVNVADYDACVDFAQRIRSQYGPVGILINGAGITRDVTLRKMSAQHWTDVIRVNLDGVFNLTRQFVDEMCDNGFGRIVNISSVNGQTGQFGQTNYSAAKAGMHGFTMALAREVARKGVTVNSVSPGYCRTQLVMNIPEAVRADIISRVPVGRMGEPHDIARVIDFLTADESSFITGANIPVNGGYYMS